MPKGGAEKADREKKDMYSGKRGELINEVHEEIHK